jgi:hypothetical protein
MIGAITAGLLSGGTAPAAATSYESISTVTVSSSVGSISFTSIPSTYKHLQIRALQKSDFTSTGLTLEAYIALNSDTTSTNYKGHYLYGNGTGANAGVSSFQSGIEYGFTSRTNPASTFNNAVIDILDYQNTNKYKTLRSLSGGDGNGAGAVGLWSSVWMNTNAVTTITLLPYSSNWTQYSSFALYGIKG